MIKCNGETMCMILISFILKELNLTTEKLIEKLDNGEQYVEYWNNLIKNINK